MLINNAIHKRTFILRGIVIVSTKWRTIIIIVYYIIAITIIFSIKNRSRLVKLKKPKTIL